MAVVLALLSLSMTARADVFVVDTPTDSVDVSDDMGIRLLAELYKARSVDELGAVLEIGHEILASKLFELSLLCFQDQEASQLKL